MQKKAECDVPDRPEDSDLCGGHCGELMREVLSWKINQLPFERISLVTEI